MCIITANEKQSWYLNGKLHRRDGPAIIYDTQYWFLNGNQYTHNITFQKAANLTDEEMTFMIMKYGNVE